jgi:hypothetical protein
MLHCWVPFEAHQPALLSSKSNAPRSKVRTPIPLGYAGFYTVWTPLHDKVSTPKCDTYSGESSWGVEWGCDFHKLISKSKRNWMQVVSDFLDIVW